MNIFNPEGKFMSGLGKMIDLFLLGMLWSLLSVTVVGFGPATTALYYAVAKAIRRDRGTTFKEFFYALKQNWWKAIWIGILLFGIGVCLILTDGMKIVGTIIEKDFANFAGIVLPAIRVVVYIAVVSYVFPVLSRFDLKIIRVIGMSVSLMVRHFWSTLITISVAAVALLFAVKDPLLILCISGFYFYILSFPMERILKIYTPKPEQFDENVDYWYLE